jgi:hypothetical protein
MDWGSAGSEAGVESRNLKNDRLAYRRYPIWPIFVEVWVLDTFRLRAGGFFKTYVGSRCETIPRSHVDG